MVMEITDKLWITFFEKCAIIENKRGKRPARLAFGEAMADAAL